MAGTRRLFGLLLAVGIAFNGLADTLVLEDGSRLAGKVTMCDDDGCSIGSKRVSRADIAAVLLGNAVLPSSAPAGSVVLSDGTLRQGHFEFLNLGYVTVDGKDLDRSGIAAIIFSEIAPPMRDVLITRDGHSSTGTLSTCNPSSCTFEGQVVPRDTTRWIGLGQEGQVPPEPPSQDTILFAGKPPEAARATSVDATTVGTTHGDFARKDVAWIYIADAPKPPPSGAYGAPSNETPQPQPPQPPPQPPQPGKKTPSPAPQPHAPSRGSNCRPGVLWTGKMAAHAWGNVDQIRSDLYMDVDVKMQETICKALGLDGKRVGAVSVFDTTGSFIRNRMTETASFLSCRGEGSGVADSNDSGQAIYRNDRADSTMAAWGFEVPKGSARYFVSIGAARDAKLVLQCRANGKDLTEEESLFSPFPGRNPFQPAFLQAFEDPEPRYLFDGKMIGSAQAPGIGLFEHVAFSWAICPPKVQCSLPPIPDESAPQVQPSSKKNPCDELMQLINAMKQLQDTYNQYEKEYKDAYQKRDEVRDKIWGMRGALRKYFSALGELAAQGASEVIERMVTAANALMDAGDNSDAGNVVAAAKQLGYVIKDEAAAVAVKNATQQADAYLAETGDHSGALRIYSANIERSEDLAAAGEKITKGLGVATGIAEYAEKTSELADLVQEWLDDNRTADEAKHNENDVNKRQDDLQKQIDDARSRLTGPCPGANAAVQTPPAARFAVLRDEPVVLRLVAQSSSGGGAKAKLADIRQRLNQTTGHLGAAGPWLYPFLLQVTMSQGLQRDLLGKAIPELKTAKENLDQAMQEGKHIDEDVGQTVPQATAPAGTTTGAGTSM